MSTFEPQSFGKYFLVDKIATGGMAEIFKAKTFSHGGFENLVVIKRILGHLSENDDFVEMFIDEAKVSVSLQHANIVRVYDFGKVFDNYFIAMECVDGKDIRAILRQLAKQRRYLPLDFALFIIHEVCRGLSYAHSKTDLRGHPYGIVHRDMSPSNVLVSYDGDVKIADFGIAKAEQNTYTTADGVLKGKFEYMSPEQARGETIDARSDLFAVGILLHEMVTGRRLFKGESDLETLERIKAAEVRRPSEVTPRVPRQIDALALRLLERDPTDRFETSGKAQAQVRALLGRSPDEVRPEFRQFLRDLFRDNIRAEIDRLEAGSAIAAEWKSTAEESLWDSNTTAAGTLHVEPVPARRRAFGVVLLAVLLFLTFGGLGALAMLYLGALGPSAPSAPVAATPGSLSVTVLPPARIFLDGEQIGEGSTFHLGEIETGEHRVRLEAPDRPPYEQTITIVEGQITPVQHTFPPPDPVEEDRPATERAPEAPRTRSTRPEPARPTVAFSSVPPGATVLVEGRAVGVTPMTWTAQPDQSYRVQLKLDGYQTYSTQLDPMGAGTQMPVSRTLAQDRVAAEPGTVAVGIIGGGWGNVFIDGKQQSKTAPSRYTVPPGARQIRIVNEELQLDHTETVRVEGGKTVRVNARR